ncbi:MAG: adenylosuccinate lyase [Planctomycetes bacterium]|nr:adenylosuccinate lyase [Planctomycetota bacterium]
MAQEKSMYTSPLVERNASPEMAELFGPQRKFSTWRRLWLELARAEKRLGLSIKQSQIDQMAQHLDDIDFKRAAKYEQELRHDVMAHIRTFGDAAPKAAPIIHLGATSCYVTDNTDLILMREGLRLLAGKVAALIDLLGRFAAEYRALPTLSFTHYQPAQLTTVGKRATLWAYEFALDLEEIEHRMATLLFRGVKGVTGNQRKLDTTVVNTLALVAQSAHKVCNDLRLLANLKEMEEPFEKHQVGSSAMPYKRNPMRCERVTGLARLVLSLAGSPPMTASEQWFERTLDDSSNRRVVLPEAFLAVDGILQILLNVFDGLVVYPQVIEAHVAAELPFMASENILMAAVKAGGNRQELHEKIRLHAQAAGAEVKRFGRSNDLIARLQTDISFAGLDFDAVLDPAAYVGRAPQQVDEFLKTIVAPIRRRYQKELGRKVELKV